MGRAWNKRGRKGEEEEANSPNYIQREIPVKKTDGKVLQTMQSPTGYCLGKSLDNAGSPVNAAVRTFGCPWSLSTLFKSAQEIRFTFEELAVAGFIFGRTAADALDPDEVLVRTTDALHKATKSNLNNFLPGKMMED